MSCAIPAESVVQEVPEVAIGFTLAPVSGAAAGAAGIGWFLKVLLLLTARSFLYLHRKIALQSIAATVFKMQAGQS